MAIPFYENEHASATATAPSDNATATATATAGDQVDGPPLLDPGFDHVDYEGPPPAAAPSAATSEPPPSAEEQLLAWKMLALTMCKVLKQFCQHHKQATGKPTKMTATVQIQPQSQ